MIYAKDDVHLCLFVSKHLGPLWMVRYSYAKVIVKVHFKQVMMTVRLSSLDIEVQEQFIGRRLHSSLGISSKSSIKLLTFWGTSCLHEFILGETNEVIKLGSFCSARYCLNLDYNQFSSNSRKLNYGLFFLIQKLLGDR